LPDNYLLKKLILDLSNVQDNRNNHKNCGAYVKRLLFSNGLGFIWESQHLINSSNSKFYDCLKQELKISSLRKCAMEFQITKN
jgi:hypothetical protein